MFPVNQSISLSSIEQVLDQPDILYRMEGESEDHYLLFTLYCKMGPGRVIAKALYQYRVAQKLIDPSVPYEPGTKNPSWIFDWMNRFHWRIRVKAYDEWQLRLEAVKTAGWVPIVRNNAWRHYEQARVLMDTYLQQLTIAAEDRTLLPNEVRELIRGLNEVDQLGRRAAGLPDRIIDKNVNISSVSISVTPDDIRAIEDTAKRELDEWEQNRRSTDNSGFTILGLDGGKENP